MGSYPKKFVLISSNLRINMSVELRYAMHMNKINHANLKIGNIR